jgi:hypothetical protein
MNEFRVVMLRILNKIPRGRQDDMDSIIAAFGELSTNAQSQSDLDKSDAAWYLSRVPEDRMHPLSMEVLAEYMQMNRQSK